MRRYTEVNVFWEVTKVQSILDLLYAMEMELAYGRALKIGKLQ